MADVDRLIEDLKDRGVFVRWRAALALGRVKDARAVEPLIEALKDNESLVRRSASEELGEIRKRLPNITREKATSIFCASCFCRFSEHKAQLGSGEGFRYYACRECHSSKLIDNVTRVIAVLDHAFDKPCIHHHRDTTLLVSWYSRKAPFDFDEIRIKDAREFDIDELVMKLSNDMDDKRRKRYKSMPVYLSPQMQLSQARMHLLKDIFGRVEETG